MGTVGRVALLSLVPACAQVFGLDPTTRRDDAGGEIDGVAGDAGTPASCGELHAAQPTAPNGRYLIDPGGGPLEVYCDMTTDGGGWTIVHAATGADGEQPLTSDVAVGGDPLAGAAHNLARAAKIQIAAGATASIFVRAGDTWLRANAPLFDAGLAVADNHAHVAVTLATSDGATASGFIGYATTNSAGGGDYDVTMEDGTTCGGTMTTAMGVDHHSTSYWHLNCGCERHYLYSYSSGEADGDAGYDVSVALGAWTATDACAAGEGGMLAFYAAMR